MLNDLFLLHVMLSVTGLCAKNWWVANQGGPYFSILKVDDIDWTKVILSNW